MMMMMMIMMSITKILMEIIMIREVFGVHQDGEEPVHCVKFSPDGSLLALGSRDNAIYTYQVANLPSHHHPCQQHHHHDGAGEGELQEVQPLGPMPRPLVPCDPAGLDHGLPTPQI